MAILFKPRNIFWGLAELLWRLSTIKQIWTFQLSKVISTHIPELLKYFAYNLLYILLWMELLYISGLKSFKYTVGMVNEFGTSLHSVFWPRNSAMNERIVSIARTFLLLNFHVNFAAIQVLFNLSKTWKFDKRLKVLCSKIIF